MKSPYNTQTWRKVRKQVLARDRFRCQIRRPKCHGYANAVHHVVDWRDGGDPFFLSNLVAACIACNTAERNSRAAAALARERGQAPKTRYHGPSRKW